METELDKYFREQREQEDSRDALLLAAFGFILLVLAFVAFLALIGWLAVEYEDIIRLKANGNI